LEGKVYKRPEKNSNEESPPGSYTFTFVLAYVWSASEPADISPREPGNFPQNWLVCMRGTEIITDIVPSRKKGHKNLKELRLDLIRDFKATVLLFLYCNIYLLGHVN